MVSAVMTIGIMADSDGSVLQRDQNGSCDLISFVFVRLKHTIVHIRDLNRAYRLTEQRDIALLNATIYLETLLRSP